MIKLTRELKNTMVSSSQAAGYQLDRLFHIRGEHSKYDRKMINNLGLERHVGGLDFLCEISKKVTEESESTKLINQILTMTIKNLKCSAASLFLVDESPAICILRMWLVKRRSQ